MKVVLGFASILEMLQKGIPVSIGTYGAPSNNRIDMMRDMYLTSIIYKGRTLNAEALYDEQILEMTTLNGAKCALMENELGVNNICNKQN